MRTTERPTGNPWSPWKRWGDLLLIGLCADMVLGLMAWKFPKETSALIHAPVEVPIAIGGLVLVWALNKRSAFLDLLGYRHFVKYPPLWVGALFGILAVWPVFAFTTRADFLLPFGWTTPTDWVWVVGVPVIFVLLAWIASKVSASLDSRRRSHKACEWKDAEAVRSIETLDALDPEALISWIADDRPLDDRFQDFLGHSRIAERIVRRLLSQDGESSQAVIGRFGSGKTSLGHLIQQRLSLPDAAKVRFIQVSLWGYQNGTAAIEGILESLLGELAKEMDCASLRGLPNHYVEAMSAGKGFWTILARILQPKNGSLQKVLEAFDWHAASVGLRFVLWIEDLERFASRQESDRVLDSESLGPIRALLHHLDALPSITVVLATVELSKTFDLEKIARFLEPLPELDRKTTGPLIARLKSDLLATHPEVVLTTLKSESDQSGLTTASWEDRNSLGREGALEDRFQSEQGVENPPGKPNAGQGESAASLNIYLSSILPKLVCTPRALKQAMRRAKECWNKYPGEIDLDDLILMNLVRSNSPKVFSLFKDHLSELRSTQDSIHGFGDGLPSFIGELTEIVPDPKERKAYRTVAAAVFSPQPSWRKMQGFKVQRPVGIDYWTRFLAEPDLEEEDRDQPVLRAIRNTDLSEICPFFEQGSTGAMILHFEQLVSMLVARNFLPSLLTRWSVHPEITAESQGLALKTLAGLWQKKASQKGWDPEIARQEICNALKKLMPHNLGQVALIQREFLGQNDPSGITQAGAQRTRRYLRAELYRTFRGRSEKLVAALQGAHSNTLRALCLGPDGEEGLKFQRAFSKTILEATALDPRAILPQVARLLMDNRGFTSDEDQANWFPNNSRMNCLSKEHRRQLSQSIQSWDIQTNPDVAIESLSKTLQPSENS